jgi:hypothetical protein
VGPAVFLNCESSLLLPAATGWRRDTGSPLALRSSNTVGPPAMTRARSGLWPRSRPGFSSLGAQKQWETLDCEVAVVVGESATRSQLPAGVVTRKERYPCTILRHKHRIEVELVHHSFSNFTFRVEGPSSRSIHCSCEGLILDCQPTEFTVLPKLAREKLVSGLGKSALQRVMAASSAGESVTKLYSGAVCKVGNTSESSAQEKQIVSADDCNKAQYCLVRSRPMGRWSSYLDVPNVLILNECDPNIQLILTLTGFVFMGAGKRGKALIVEHSKPPFHVTLAAAT